MQLPLVSKGCDQGVRAAPPVGENPASERADAWSSTGPGVTLGPHVHATYTPNRVSPLENDYP
jgi:hypothetical protein